jgi:hypothetical protein
MPDDEYGARCRQLAATLAAAADQVEALEDFREFAPVEHPPLPAALQGLVDPAGPVRAWCAANHSDEGGRLGAA